MFVQVIQGTTDDRESLKRQMDRWDTELKSGAKGYLGTTFGVTKSGECIGMARFDSEQSAMANSNRPEQGAWWSETEKCLSNDPAFYNTTKIDIILQGGSDKASFVQVMQGQLNNYEKLRKLEQENEALMTKYRPDVIGTIRAVYDNNQYTEFVYFTSEEEARANESKPIPEEFSKSFDDWQGLVDVKAFYDITDPWLTSA